METCFHCSQVSSCFDLAQHLLAGQGYERTTVDALAAAALMSKRSFFRYFASEEELVLGKFDLVGERLAALLDERPDDEPLWGVTAAHVRPGCRPGRGRHRRGAHGRDGADRLFDTVAPRPPQPWAAG
jgi:AcrR family transcriptional regulator